MVIGQIYFSVNAIQEGIPTQPDIVYQLSQKIVFSKYPKLTQLQLIEQRCNFVRLRWRGDGDIVKSSAIITSDATCMMNCYVNCERSQTCNPHLSYPALIKPNDYWGDWESVK